MVMMKKTILGHESKQQKTSYFSLEYIVKSG